MDERLEKALEFSNYMTTLNNQKRIIKEQFSENCIHYLDGGKFTVNRELITFCHTLIQNSQTSAVIIDDNDTPIDVKDLQKFVDDILNIYFTASYEYLDKYTEIKTNRSVKGLINI
jgi:hypothetical protein